MIFPPNIWWNSPVNPSESGALCFRRLLIIKLSGFVSFMACNSETDVFVDG